MYCKLFQPSLLCAFAALVISLFMSCDTVPQAPVTSLRSGDIIFHTSASSQSKAIQLATKSEYSHCGIIYVENGKTYVIEAKDPVKRSSFEEFTRRGVDGKYVVKRLRNADEVLSDEVLQRMKKIAEKMIGKQYDEHFNWSDDEIYCSELVWKIYHEGAGIELASLRHLKDFDFSNPLVRKTLDLRYRSAIPWEEPVVSPANIFDSDQLELVK